VNRKTTAQQAVAPAGRGPHRERPYGASDERRFLRNFLLHFRPAQAPERSVRFTLAWGLGAASFVLLAMLFLSGLLLKFVYDPSPAGAYGSVVFIQEQVTFGRLLRNLHRWSGYGLLLAAFLHLLRVFYTGAFRAPRRANWLVGLALLAGVTLSNFTGYLLPWDQVSYWAATLLNFYALHTAILPLALVFGVSFHFWRIRKAGGLVLLRRPGEDIESPPRMVRTVPHVVTRELALALTVIAGAVLVAMLVDAPLAAQANPGLSPNPTKAPWYFMGVQEILMHFHPLFAVLVIPGLALAGLLALPFLRYDTNAAGAWFLSRKGRRLALASAVAGTLLTTAAVLADERVLRTGGAAAAELVRNGLLPFVATVAVAAAWYLGLRRLFGANRDEAVQGLFTLLLAGFVTLTMIGVWFRGPGMQLQWAG